MCSFPKISQFLSRSCSACMKERILMKIVWGLLFTNLVATITLSVSFTREEVSADPILQGIMAILVAMCLATLACFMAAISRD